MKKYLFLIVLFVFYLALVFKNNDVEPVLSYDDKYNDDVYDITAQFPNGINSNNLINLFNKFDGDYYIYQLNINNEIINVSCTNINECISQTYEQKNNLFNTIYLTNGFNIKNIRFLSYKENSVEFLKNININYKLN